MNTITTISGNALAWLSMGQGRICLGKRPDKAHCEQIRKMGVTHLATVQTGDEGAQQYKTDASEAGLNWTWLPFQTAYEHTSTEEAHIKQYITELRALLDEGASIYLHCDGTQQRCSLLFYALCINKGFPASSAYAALHSFGSQSANSLSRGSLEWAAALGK